MGTKWAQKSQKDGRICIIRIDIVPTKHSLPPYIAESTIPLSSSNKRIIFPGILVLQGARVFFCIPDNFAASFFPGKVLIPETMNRPSFIGTLYGKATALLELKNPGMNSRESIYRSFQYFFLTVRDIHCHPAPQKRSLFHFPGNIRILRNACDSTVRLR